MWGEAIALDAAEAGEVPRPQASVGARGPERCCRVTVMAALAHLLPYAA
jgi:hypothetical protein